MTALDMHALTIEGHRVACRVGGTGQPLVLLHSGAASGAQWTRVIETLAPRFRLVVPDLWGFGETDPWRGGVPLSHDHNAVLVARVLSHFGIATAGLVGHSYGGSTAVRLVLRNPEIATRLLLIEPAMFHLLATDGDPTLYREYAQIAEGFIARAAANDADSGWRAFLDYWNGAGTWDRINEKARDRFRMQTLNTVAGFRTNLDNPTTRDDLSRIQVPATLAMGTSTNATARRVCNIVRGAIPDITYAPIDGAEHMSPLTHPGPVARVIQQCFPDR